MRSPKPLLQLAATAGVAFLAGPAAAAYGMYGMYGDDLMPPPDMCPCPGDEGLLNFGGINVPGALLQHPLPIPDSAAGAPADAALGFSVEQVAADLYAVTVVPYITLFALTDAGVVLFDAPPLSAAVLPAAVATVTDAPIAAIVYTHTHTDHIGGAADVIAAVGGGVAVVSVQEIADSLAERGDPRRPVPTEIFPGDGTTVNFGGLAHQLRVFPGVHSDADVVVYFLAQKVLLVVDIVYPGWTPFRSFGLVRDIEKYVDLHETLLEFDFDVFIGNHVTRLGDRADVQTNLDFTLSVKAAAAAGLDAVTVPDAVALVGADAAATNPWAVFYTFQALQVEACYDAVLAEWGGVLAGVDVYSRSHCFVWRDFLSLDASAEEIAAAAAQA